MKTFCPSDKQDWRNWLRENHLKEDSVWLIFYKKSAPMPNLSWSEAVDEALCYGWIDSVKKSIDHEKYKQYFGKRKPKSIWSRINKDKVKVLIEEGLMEDAGYKSIKIARENGSWIFLDDVEQLILPEDLKEALAKYPGALEYYGGLPKTAKKGLLYWVKAAKKAETREKRIKEIAENAGKQLKPKQFR